MCSYISVDFPDPDTPVMRRVFQEEYPHSCLILKTVPSRMQVTFVECVFWIYRDITTQVVECEDLYFWFIRFHQGPWNHNLSAHTCPGPMSTIVCGKNSVLTCSTTIMVLPISRSSFSVLMRRSLRADEARWLVVEHIKRTPQTWVRPGMWRIRWPSPPESVPARRLRVR